MLLIFNNKKCIKLFWSEGHKNSKTSTGLIAIIQFILKKYKYFLVPNRFQDFLLKDSKIEKIKQSSCQHNQESIFNQKSIPQL